MIGAGGGGEDEEDDEDDEEQDDEEDEDEEDGDFDFNVTDSFRLAATCASVMFSSSLSSSLSSLC